MREEQNESDNSFKLDLSQSIKNPFGEPDQDDNGSQDSSKFINSNDNDENSDVSPVQVSNDSDKKQSNVRKSAMMRKKWDKGNTQKSSMISNAQNDNTINNGSDSGDNSSFIQDFQDLVNSPKKKENAMSQNSDFLKPEIIPKAQEKVGFTFDGQMEDFLQYIHAVS